MQSSVTGLPATTREDQLKKAVLQWALDESGWERSTGHPEEADQLQADVAAALPIPMGQALRAPENLFPPIADFAHNPIAQDAVQTAEKLVTAGVSTDPNALMNNPTGPGDYNNHLTPDALLLAEMLCHPQSPLQGNAQIIPVMFHRFETIYRNHQPGSKDLANFGFSPNITQMYLMIKTVYPSLILPSRQKEWESSLLANSDAIMKLRAGIFRAGVPCTAYPNADVKYISALAYASAIFPRPDFLDVARAGEKLMSTAIYPDGGWTYIGEQNENFTYHGIDITETARLSVFDHDPLALQNLKASRWYLPLSIEPPGVAEYSMAPSWKHYWNQIKGEQPGTVMASVLNDPENERIARMDTVHGDLILASFYRDDVTPAPAPDNYFVYDRNIQGPRGRFGTFSFSATGRAMPHEDRGKSTFVGCMKLFPADHLPDGIKPGYPLDVALDIAGSQVTTKTDAPPVALSREETNAVTVGRRLAAVTTHYRLAPYHGAAIDWTGEQAWLITPRRMVGLVTIICDREQGDFGADGFIHFIANLPGKSAATRFESSGGNIFKLGGLTTQVRETDYARIDPVYQKDRVFRANLQLIDPKVKEESSPVPVKHEPGESHFYLAEIYPDTSTAAPAVMRLRAKADSALVGFEVDEGDHHYRLVYNPSARNESYQGVLAWGAGKIWEHRSGEQYRPAWIAADGKEELTQPPTPLDTTGGQVQIPIPAGTHVVLTDVE